MNNITSKLHSLSEIIKDRYFIIPDYQRGYSWEEKQWIDLKKDIENLFDKKHNHYTGTIVATTSKADKFKYDIVDGQQRLTTLIILLMSIYNKNKIKYINLFDFYIQRGSLGNEKLVLTPNKETASYFEEVVIKGSKIQPKIKSQENIKEAKTFFDNWINENNTEIDKIIEIVTNKLGFLFFTPNNDKEIGIMFEVINNRGKALSELEKIKNYFIYYSTIHGRDKLRQDINTKWENLQINLSYANVYTNVEENNFLRYCYLVFYSNVKSRSRYVYHELKSKYNVQNNDNVYIDNNIKEIQDFIDFIEKASLYYAYLFNRNKFFESHYNDPHYKRRFSNILKLIRSQYVHASILPLYLAIMMRQDEPAKVLELLEILEIVNFRIYILPKITSRADTYQGDMFWFARFFYLSPNWNSNDPNATVFDTRYNNKRINGDIFNWVKLQLIELTKLNCPEQSFIQALTLDAGEGGNYFNWPGLRYFLGNYEKMLQKMHKHNWDIELIAETRENTKETLNDYLSREHIWASENRSDDFPSNYLEKRRLGNFVLLGLSKNIALSNSDIPDKITELQDKNNLNNGNYHMYQVDELKDFYKEALKFLEKDRGWVVKTKNYYENLSYKINDLRETKLIHFGLNRWKLPNERFTKFDRVDTYLARKDKKKEVYILK